MAQNATVGTLMALRELLLKVIVTWHALVMQMNFVVRDTEIAFTNLRQLQHTKGINERIFHVLCLVCSGVYPSSNKTKFLLPILLQNT